MHIQIAQSVTRIMPTYPPIETCAHVFDAQNIHQKRSKFMRARGDGLRPGPPLFIIRKQSAEMMNHRGARSGGADDRIRAFEDFNEAPRQRPRL